MGEQRVAEPLGGAVVVDVGCVLCAQNKLEAEGCSPRDLVDAAFLSGFLVGSSVKDARLPLCVRHFGLWSVITATVNAEDGDVIAARERIAARGVAPPCAECGQPVNVIVSSKWASVCSECEEDPEVRRGK